MTAVLSPMPRFKAFDPNGYPLAGGKLYTYAAGSSTQKATYTDSTGTVPNANPVILDVNGEADVWLTPNIGYKFILKDANDNILWSVDSISAGGTGASGAVSQWISTGQVATYVTASQFSVPGDQRNSYQVNQRVRCSVSSGTLYGTVTDVSYASNLTTITVKLDSGALDNGLNSVDTGFLTPLSDAIPRIVALKADVDAQFAQMFTTGDGKITLKNTPDPGWIRADDGTIGSAASGASNRANADCQALFTLLWNNVADAYAPVTGGRGASAAADWSANKKIALTKTLGRAIAAAGSGSGLTGRALGQALGEEAHVLVVNEIPPHVHPTDDGGSFITDANAQGVTAPYSGGGLGDRRVNTGSTGGGQAHNNMQPTSFWNVMIKL